MKLAILPKPLTMKSRRKAIAERCLDCSGFSYQDRSECAFSDCQLFPFRTGSGKQDPDARKTAIRAYCRNYYTEGGDYSTPSCPSLDCPLFAFRLSKIDGGEK